MILRRIANTLWSNKSVIHRATGFLVVLFALTNAFAHAADDTTAALVNYLLHKQTADGSWVAQAVRPPSEGSQFTPTGLALRVLKVYAPGPEGKETGELAARIAKARALGLAWLAQAE